MDNGQPLSEPYITAKKTTSPSSSGKGYGASGLTTEGKAKITLLVPGEYKLEAFATVDGSVTKFANLTVTVGEGETIVIGGTSRKVTSPTNMENGCDSNVTVEGTATDDQGIQSITINGQGERKGSSLLLTFTVGVLGGNHV